MNMQIRPAMRQVSPSITTPGVVVMPLPVCQEAAGTRQTALAARFVLKFGLDFASFRAKIVYENDNSSILKEVENEHATDYHRQRPTRRSIPGGCLSGEFIRRKSADNARSA